MFPAIENIRSIAALDGNAVFVLKKNFFTHLWRTSISTLSGTLRTKSDHPQSWEGKDSFPPERCVPVRRNLKKFGFSPWNFFSGTVSWAASESTSAVTFFWEHICWSAISVRAISMTSWSAHHCREAKTGWTAAAMIASLSFQVFSNLPTST